MWPAVHLTSALGAFKVPQIQNNPSGIHGLLPQACFFWWSPSAITQTTRWHPGTEITLCPFPDLSHHHTTQWLSQMWQNNYFFNFTHYFYFTNTISIILQRIDLHPVQATPCGLAGPRPSVSCHLLWMASWCHPSFLQDCKDEKVQTEGFDLVSVYNLAPEVTVWNFLEYFIHLSHPETNIL